MMKRLTCILLSALFLVPLLALTVPAGAASGVIGDNLYWTLENGTLTLTGAGATPRYERSDATDSVPVPWWNQKDEVTSLVIEEGIDKLDNYAFYRMSNLREVTLPESLTRVETRVFKGCKSLESITFPQRLSFVGYEAFVETGLKEITFLGNAPKVSSTAPFTGVVAAVNYNGDGAFLSTAFGGTFTWNVQAPKVDDIPDADEVVITAPEKQGACGTNATWAFKDGLLVISGAGEMDKYTRNPDLDKVNSEWFDFRNEVKRVVVNPGITRINNYAFYRCEKLESVVIPTTVSAVNFGAFKGCAALTEIELPKALIEIGSQAFAGSGLKKITFRGAIPSDIGDLMTDGLVATLYYPCTEPEVSLANVKVFGGELTWGRFHEFENGVCKNCGLTEDEAEKQNAEAANAAGEGAGEGAGETPAAREEKPGITLSALTVINLCLTVTALGCLALAMVLVLRMTGAGKKEEKSGKTRDEEAS